jgi:hypothetical protein
MAAGLPLLAKFQSRLTTNPLFGVFFSLLALFLLTGAVVGILNLNWHP